MKHQIATTPRQARRLMGCGLRATTADMSYTKWLDGTLTTIPYERQAAPAKWPAWSLSALLAFLSEIRFKVRVREWMKSSDYKEPECLNVLLKHNNGFWGVYLELNVCGRNVQEAFSKAEDPVEAVVQTFEAIFFGDERKDWLAEYSSLLNITK